MKGSRPLTDREVERVERSLAPRDRALFVLGICSGFRISEILSLRINSVFQTGHIVDQVAVEKKNMKGKIEGRIVPLNHKAKDAIGAYLKFLRRSCRRLDPRRFLFASRIGRGAITRNQAWRILNDAFVAQHVSGKLGTHSMRKTFAHKIYELLKHDLIRTQKALGHKSVNSTVSYLSFAESEVTDAILAAW